jgi:hypothetical protein
VRGEQVPDVHDAGHGDARHDPLGLTSLARESAQRPPLHVRPALSLSFSLPACSSPRAPSRWRTGNTSGGSACCAVRCCAWRGMERAEDGSD